MRLVCILPAHNEASVLARTVENVSAWGGRMFPGDEVRVVISENGSSDGTAGIAEGLASSKTDIQAVISKTPGKGGAIKRGAAVADADIYIAMDCDLSTNLETAAKLVEAVRGGADLAIASRRMPDSKVARPLLRRLSTWTYSTIVSRYLGLGVRDAHCGCKAWSRDFRDRVLSTVADDGFFFDTELLARARKAGSRVVEIGAEWSEPAGRKSTVKMVPTAMSFLRKLPALKKLLGL